MKFKLLYLILFFSIEGICQMSGIHKFKKVENDYKYEYFKIKGKVYKTDFKTFEYEDKVLYENSTNDITHFMIYKKRYLFVSYYPNTIEQQMSSIGYEIRPLNRLDIIDLQNSSKIWIYDFNGKTCIGNIKNFDPLNGVLIYCNKHYPVISNN